MNGYLSTITRDAENTFLGTLSSHGWIGASDQDDEGNFIWADGPEAGTFLYSHWNSGEPNNAGDEDYVHYQGGNWTDLPNGATQGYFVEYNTSAGPEPASRAMMLAGFGLMGFVTRNRRKGVVTFT